MEDDYIKRYFNRVNHITAICRSTINCVHGDYPELEIGKTYNVSHIGVLRSSTNIILSEFPNMKYNAGCFDIYENDEECICSQDPRFLAPYLRNHYINLNPVILSSKVEKYSIPAYLRNVEKEYGVRILLAVESGSRAWGFESKNSDWDVRFIYVHKPEWYFNIEEHRDVIEHIYDEDIDMVGWELRKALTLLGKNNPTLLEWINSPKIYYVDLDFSKRIQEIQKQYFNPIRSMYHYNRIYNKHNDKYLQKEGFNLKRYLYYLRGILACKWIETNQSIPPVNFLELLDATIEDISIKDKVQQLITLKKSGTESDISDIDIALINYAQQLANYYDKTILEFRPEQRKSTYDVLDKLLFDMVNA